ncbi:unnamed protein product [Rotaria sp. Silwood2]|nr:unnamed protein product [Rotaria sp. Silwood2]
MGVQLHDGTWSVLIGFQARVDELMNALREQARLDENEYYPSSNITSTSDHLTLSIELLNKFPALSSLIKLCTDIHTLSDRNDLTLLIEILNNICTNLTRSKNNFQYSDYIMKFAILLFIYSGRNAYRFVSLNVPGFLPSITTIKKRLANSSFLSDYCDIDFVRETLSSNWSAIQVQPIREKLVSRLYNPNNTDPIKCFSNNSCLQNESFCFVVYSYFESLNDAGAVGTCRNMNKLPQVQWSQSYEANGVGKSLIELGSYYCNTPTCGYNSSAIETFQMLSHEYILPVNLSVINATTLPWPTETTPLTAMSTIGVTTSNGAPYILVDFFNTLMISFLITKYF